MVNRDLEATSAAREFPPLERSDLPSDPLPHFELWLAEAQERVGPDAQAFSLSTVDPEGRPASRMVLLKGISPSGLVLYTNYRSRKSRHLIAHPWASGGFWWPPLGRQVRFEGRVESASKDESDAYFASRPRDSQLAAWASPQSEGLASRKELEERYAAIASRFEGQDVDRPPHWGGLRVVPDAWEFWQARRNRLHDRFRYTLDAEGRWALERLGP